MLRLPLDGCVQLALQKFEMKNLALEPLEQLQLWKQQFG